MTFQEQFSIVFAIGFALLVICAITILWLES